MDKELERVRAEAAGIELDEELAARFPVKSRQKLEIPVDEADITVYLYEPENRTGVTPLIINLHGGEISVRSGGGETEFEFTLPLAPEQNRQNNA